MLDHPLLDALRQIVETGGPVVAILLCVSVIALAVILYKLWQFRRARVGSHRSLHRSIALWDAGERTQAREIALQSKSYLTPVILTGFSARNTDTAALSARLNAEAEAEFLDLESGFRFLDNVAQLAPLLGLFGTVLGMISAFQALQQAGNQVDPSILAGGIWVALLTTAVGLAVAMPASVILSWFEQRIEAERVLVEQAIRTIVAPKHA